MTTLAALTTIVVHGQVAPATSVLVFVDLAHTPDDDRARITELGKSIVPEAETRIWSGFRDDPVSRYRLSFGEAFETFRGNATVLQSVKARECADNIPSCGADLPLRARQALDSFDELARATIADLIIAVNDLATRTDPRPHAVVFVTLGLPYRTEPRRELEALRGAIRRSATTLAIVDAGTTGRASPGVARMTAVLGGASYPANADGLRNLRASLATDSQGGSKDPPLRTPGSSRLLPEVDIASKHAVAFAESAETLLADEHYVQEVKTRPSATAMPRYSTSGITIEKRELDSEVALIQLKSGELWLLARDVQRVDNQKVEEARRIPLPTVHPGTDAQALQQLRTIAAQGARFNVGGIRRDLNVPTLALWLLTPGVLPRLDFSVGATETIDGRRTVVVRLQERRAPYLFHVDDVPTPVSGRFWLDRERGAVVRTELSLRSAAGRPAATAQIVVNYRFDPNVGAWVPRDMAEQYNSARTQPFVVANATYSNVRRFSSSVRIVK